MVKMVDRVIVNQENWKLSKCICYDYQKKYICVHVIGLAIRLKLVVPPTRTINLEFNEKAKWGRKPISKGGNALIVD